MAVKIKKAFSFDVDNMVYPREILENLARDIGAITRNLVIGEVKNYDGDIYSKYEESRLSELVATSLAYGKMIKNIQDELGENGDGRVRLEFCITAPELKEFKCRILFAEYGYGGYPVTVVMESELASELLNDKEYITVSDNMGEFKRLIDKVFKSDYLFDLLQRVITESLVRKKKRERNNENKRNRKKD